MRDSDPTVEDLASALIRHLPRAVVPLAELAEALGISRIGVRRLAKLAEAEDKAIYWHDAGGVILSVSEASQLGRELRSSSTDSEVAPESWFWTKPGRPEFLDLAERFRPDRGLGGDEGNILDDLTTTDCHIEEDDPLIRKCLEKLAAPSRITSLRWRKATENVTVRQIVAAGGVPTTIKPIGLGLSWNPAIEVTHSPDCRVCRGRKLGLLTFCLACCRAGLDGILPNVAASEKPKPAAYVPDPDGLAGGVGSKVA
jgi:hypothetical protein